MSELKPITLQAETSAGKLKEITDKLEQGITELFESEQYKNYLNVMSKFHNYSFRNTLLIAMQKPDASLVAGYTAWKTSFGRQVLKGQKGIKIIAPAPYKIKQEVAKFDAKTKQPVIGREGQPVTEEVEITVAAYKVTTVFDISQTEGRELPSIAPQDLEGDVEQYNIFFRALEQASPVPVGIEKMEGNMHGYYHLEEKRIALREGMSELQSLKTLIHEIAHARLHDVDLENLSEQKENAPDRRTKEVQAESVAYTVCQHYGLDTSDYSFGYIAGWSSGKELSELKESLETIRNAAAGMIEDIDKNMKEIVKSLKKEEIATITCEWSEHPVFEDGKTYSVLEFDELMKSADAEWCWKHKHDELYSKVKFTVNLPDGMKYVERQDIGDGYGGVIDFFKNQNSYVAQYIAENLEAAKKINLKQVSLEKASKPSIKDKLAANKEAVKNAVSTKNIKQSEINPREEMGR